MSYSSFRSYCFVSARDADVFGQGVLSSGSASFIRLYPVRGGTEVVVKDNLGAVDAPAGGWEFVQYMSTVSQDTSGDAQFEEAFAASGARYRCVSPGSGDDFTVVWILFGSNKELSKATFSTSVSMWVVRWVNGVAAAAEAVDLGIPETENFQVGGQLTATRYLFSVDVDGGSSFTMAGEGMQTNQSDVTRQSPDERYTPLGVIQPGTRGATVAGGSEKYAGFLVQLGSNGMIDNSVLPSSIQGFETAISNEKDERILADEEIAGNLSRHEGFMNNPHGVKGSQLVSDDGGAVRMVQADVYANGKKLATEEMVENRIGAIGSSDGNEFTIGGVRVGFREISIEGRKYRILAALDDEEGWDDSANWSPTVKRLKVRDGENEDGTVSMVANGGLLFAVDDSSGAMSAVAMASLPDGVSIGGSR